MRVTAILFLILSITTAASGQDRLLWEQRFDANGGTDIARAVTASQRTVVLVGGATSSSSTDMVVRGFNKRTGKIRWTQKSPLASGINTAVYAIRFQGIVYTAGYSPDGPGSDIEVHAYTAANGRTVWQDVFNRGRDDFPQDLAANRTAVVVVGYGGNTPGHNVDFLVRAYHPLTGEMLWEDQVDSGGDDQAWEVALSDTQAIVAGSAGSGLILRAYDLNSGALAWDVRQPSFSPTRLEVRGGRVFVGGSRASVGASPGGAATLVFTSATGQPMWSDAAGSGAVNDLQIRDGRVVEIGNFGVRMLDVRTGTPLWTQSPVSAPGRFEFLNLVEVGPDAIFVAGSSVVEFGNSELVLRAFDLNGQLLWEERALSSPNTGPHDLALNRSTLFVAGHVTDGSTRSDFFLRAYDVSGIAQSED